MADDEPFAALVEAVGGDAPALERIPQGEVILPATISHCREETSGPAGGSSSTATQAPLGSALRWLFGRYMELDEFSVHSAEHRVAAAHAAFVPLTIAAPRWGPSWRQGCEAQLQTRCRQTR